MTNLDRIEIELLQVQKDRLFEIRRELRGVIFWSTGTSFALNASLFLTGLALRKADRRIAKLTARGGE